MKRTDGVFVADALANIRAYADYGAHFAPAVEFLARPDLASLPDGRYELDGANAYAMVQEATLRPWGSARPEVHRAYFDVQVPLSRGEIIGVGTFDPATPGDFDAARDIGFYDGIPVEPLVLAPGEFAILHPGTCAHAPCCTDGAVGGIRKIVVKVRR